MSIPALFPGADSRSIIERVNQLIRERNVEVAVATPIQSGALNLDLRIGRMFRVVVDADFAVAVANAIVGSLNILILELEGDGAAHAATWSGWTWLTGTPVLTTAAGKNDLVVALSIDGSAWLAAMIAQHYP